MKVKYGCTRIVLVMRRIVIKVPNFTYSWDHFLKGLVANIHEWKTWKYSKSPLLCPVLWSSWGGWIIVMRKADVECHIDDVFEMAPFGDIDPEEETRIRYKEYIDAGFGGDDKADSYGYIDSRLVKVDYGSS